MQIWVDADACPNAVKEILYKTATRTKTTVTFVANQWITIPNSPYLRLLIVSQGFDEADNKIVECVKKNDIVITADIPLAAEVIEKSAQVLTPRGDCYDISVIKERLIIRDFHETLRASGIQTGGPSSFSNKDKERFANQLQQLLKK